MPKKFMLSLTNVENGGLIVTDRVYPEKQYVFTDPYSFYSWLCQQMETNAKPDSQTLDGRVVTSYNKLERLEKIEAAAWEVCRHPYDTPALRELEQTLMKEGK